MLYRREMDEIAKDFKKAKMPQQNKSALDMVKIRTYSEVMCISNMKYKFEVQT